MNTYKIIFTRENGTQGADHFTAINERQARKDFGECYQDMKLVQISKVGKSYWFILAEKTAEEKQKELATAALATNANSITDLQLALAEVYEMIIGGK